MLEIHSLEIHIVSTGEFCMECTRLVVAAGGVAAAVVTALGTSGPGPVPGAVPVATTLLRPTEPTVLASAPPPRDTLRASNRAW